MATDPICGMTVDPKNAAGKHEYDGQTYYFCSQHCVTQFKKDPERFLKPGEEPWWAPRRPSGGMAIIPPHWSL